MKKIKIIYLENQNQTTITHMISLITIYNCENWTMKKTSNEKIHLKRDDGEKIYRYQGLTNQITPEFSSEA